MDSVAGQYLTRVNKVVERLVKLARPLPGLTPPDEVSGEQWEAQQVWGHINEFLPYWIEQFEHVVEAYRGEPVPFGRARSDPLRLQGIEAGRSMDPTTHLHWLELHAKDLEGFLRALDESSFKAQGVHPRLGVMDLEAMIADFLVGHLEEHADQLEGLVGT